MIVSGNTIMSLNKRYKLIENTSEDKSLVWGAGVGVRLGQLYRLKGDSALSASESRLPISEKVADLSEGDKIFVIEKNDYLLGKTVEKINMPTAKIDVGGKIGPALLIAEVFPRSTLLKCGVSLMATRLEPGYSGEVGFAMINISGCPMQVDMGVKIANLVFKTFEGEV